MKASAAAEGRSYLTARGQAGDLRRALELEPALFSPEQRRAVAEAPAALNYP